MKAAVLFATLLLLAVVHAQPGLTYMQEFSVFTQENLNIFQSNTEGRIAVGGGATIADYTVGLALPFDCKRTDLLVGGDLSFTNGEISRGRIVYRGTITLSDVGLGCPSHQSVNTYVNFEEVFVQLNETSLAFGSHPSNTEVTTQYSTLTLTGDSTEVNYFLLSSDTLAETTNIDLNIPTNSTAIISVSGTGVNFVGMDVHISNTTDPRRVLWNLWEATDVSIQNIFLRGSVLAPFANVEFTSGTLGGSIASLTLTGSGAIQYVPFIPPESNCTCFDCPAIWSLPRYSIFVADTCSLQNSADDGRMAVGGDASFSGYSIANAISTQTTFNSTVIGGNLEFTSGAISTGNVVVAGTATLTDVYVAGVLSQNTQVAVDFEATFSNLAWNSLYFSKLQSNGVVDLVYSTLNLISNDIGLNIFTVSSEEFSGASVVSINCPSTSWAVINIPDSDAKFQGLEVQLTGITQERVIFNFYQAVTLTIDSVGVLGSVMAPAASVTFGTGNINGNLAAQSLTGSGFVAFVHPLPLKPPCLPCICI